jgi:hypothetical protein
MAMRSSAMCLAATLGLVAALGAGPASRAQSQQPAINGRWRATLTAPDGREFRFLFDFQAKDRMVTGTVSVDGRPPVAIQNGRLRGTNSQFISFVRESADDSGDKLLFSGIVGADEISFALTRLTAPDIPATVRFTAMRADQ